MEAPARDALPAPLMAPVMTVLRRCIALAALLLAAVPLAAAAAAENEARGRFVLATPAGPMLPVWYQLPDQVAPDTPVVVVMHGVKRDADRYRDEWANLAQAYRMIVVVPEFSEADFPGSRGYNTGFLTRADGTPRPRALWSFGMIEPLFDAVRSRFGTQVPRYTIYGHSAGAQFVHRFVMFMPEARIEQAIAANAGWYTLPDPAIAYPYGTGSAPIAALSLTASLGQPLMVLLGTADNNPNASDLRTTPEANAQGPHRFARGQSFFAAGRAAATRLGTGFGWKLELVPGVGHQNGLMANAAARLIAERRDHARAVSPPPPG